MTPVVCQVVEASIRPMSVIECRKLHRAIVLCEAGFKALATVTCCYWPETARSCLTTYLGNAASLLDLGACNAAELRLRAEGPQG